MQRHSTTIRSSWCYNPCFSWWVLRLVAIAAICCSWKSGVSAFSASAPTFCLSSSDYRGPNFFDISLLFAANKRLFRRQNHQRGRNSFLAMRLSASELENEHDDSNYYYNDSDADVADPPSNGDYSSNKKKSSVPYASISSIVTQDMLDSEIDPSSSTPKTPLQVFYDTVEQMQLKFGGTDAIDLVSDEDPDWYDIPCINSLVFTINNNNFNNNDYILVVIASDDRVDETALEKAVQSILSSNAEATTEPTITAKQHEPILVQLAPSSTVADLCGFSAGSVPPLGLSPSPLMTIVDQKLTQQQETLTLVRAGGGLSHQSCLVSMPILAQQNQYYVAPVAAANRRELSSFPARINGDGGFTTSTTTGTPILSQPKPFFVVEPPDEKLARAAVEAKDDDSSESAAALLQLQPVAVSVVARIAGIRRMARQLAFCDLVPPDGVVVLPSSPAQGGDDGHLYAWRSAVTNETIAVQLIAGKTLCQNNNDDDGDSIRRLQVGQLIWVQGRTNVQSRDSLQNWVEKKSLDIVVDSYQILQERDVAVDEAFAQARVQQKRDRRKLFAAPSKSDEPPVDPATCLRLTDLYQYGTTSGTPSPLLVDNMQAVKEFAKDLSQLLTSLRKLSDDDDKKKTPLPLVGVDCEWQPNFLLASPRDPQPVMLLQICLHPLERIYLFDLKMLLRPMMPPTQSMDKLEKEVSFALGALFESKMLIKVGFQVVHDLRQLAASYPHISSLQFYNAVLESSTLGKKAVRMLNQGNAREATSSLARLVRHSLGKNLNKQEQCSDWSLRPLTESQMEYAALDAAVTPIIVDKMVREMDVQIFPEAKLGRWPNDASFRYSITSWRFVFVDTTDPNAQRKLKARRVVANELVVSQSWNTGYQIPPKLPALPEKGSDGPYVDTSGILQVPSTTVSIRNDRTMKALESMLGQIIGKSKEKCVSLFLRGPKALPEGARLHYPQRTGYIEFQDGVALFVNMPSRARGQPHSYPNEWLDEGRVLTWFLRERDWHRPELAQKFTDAASVVTLFVRMGATGSFLCCGRCRVQVDDPSRNGKNGGDDDAVPDNWTLVELRLNLLDWKRLQTSVDFQDLLRLDTLEDD